MSFRERTREVLDDATAGARSPRRSSATWRLGYAKTTLDDVARELHISKKTIYVHFDGKREIYAYIVAQQAAREQARLRGLVAELPDPARDGGGTLAYVVSMARAHDRRDQRVEWMQEYEIAADSFRKANGDLLREIVRRASTSASSRPATRTWSRRWSP